MDVDKIDINISDKKTVGILAFRFDKPEFIKDLKRARKRLGLKKLISNRLVEKVEINNPNAWAVQTEAQREAGKTGISGVTIMTDADIETERLVKKYRFPVLFTNAVKHAIMSGEVTEKNIEHRAECLLIEPNDYVELAKQGTFEEPFLAVQFTPDSKEKDILKAFRNRKAALKDYFRVVKKRKREPDTISNINRDRDWYWKNVKGASYHEIWKEEKGISEDGIARAIGQYKKRLMDV